MNLNIFARLKSEGVKKGTREAESELKRFSSSAKTLLASIGVAFGAMQVARWFKGAVSAAFEYNKILETANAQVQVLTGTSRDLRGELDALGNKWQDLTNFGNVEVVDTIQTLTLLTGSYTKALEVLPLTLDLAASGMFDLNTAARYMGQVMQGELTILGRYFAEFKGVDKTLGKTATTAEKAAYGLEVLTDKVGGLAEKMADTDFAKAKDFSDAISDLERSIGTLARQPIAEIAADLAELAKAATAAMPIPPDQLTAEQRRGGQRLAAGAMRFVPGGDIMQALVELGPWADKQREAREETEAFITSLHKLEPGRNIEDLLGISAERAEAAAAAFDATMARLFATYGEPGKEKYIFRGLDREPRYRLARPEWEKFMLGVGPRETEQALMAVPTYPMPEEMRDRLRIMEQPVEMKVEYVQWEEELNEWADGHERHLERIRMMWERTFQSGILAAMRGGFEGFGDWLENYFDQLASRVLAKFAARAAEELLPDALWGAIAD